MPTKTKRRKPPVTRLVEPVRPARVLSLSDFHTGNLAGLTPPAYNPDTPGHPYKHKQYLYRKALWEWFASEVDRLRPIDICVANGDLIDGKGKKAGGTDQFTVDGNEQIDIARAILKFVGASEYHFTYGTGYHTGTDDDWEYQIARDFGGDIEDVLTLDVRGLKMRWRHHTGTSQSQTSRATSLMRQQEWDVLWSAHGEFERADVLVYSHAHYYQAIANRFGTAIIMPALQGLGGSKYGGRRLGALIDYGFVHFDVTDPSTWSYQPHLLKQRHEVRNGSLVSVLAKV